MTCYQQIFFPCGIQQVFTSCGNPNGKVYVPHPYPAICIDDTGKIWTKTDGQPSDKNWK